MTTTTQETSVHSDIWVKLIQTWQTVHRTLPIDSGLRKEIPLATGCYQYFPAGLACVAVLSKLGNDKHNPGEPLHHARGKSTDHEDCIARHNVDVADAQRAGNDAIELEEAACDAWRALARLQLVCERLGAPLAPAARLPEVAPAPKKWGVFASDGPNGTEFVRSGILCRDYDSEFEAQQAIRNELNDKTSSLLRAIKAGNYYSVLEIVEVAQ